MDDAYIKFTYNIIVLLYVYLKLYFFLCLDHTQTHADHLKRMCQQHTIYALRNIIINYFMEKIPLWALQKRKRFIFIYTYMKSKRVTMDWGENLLLLRLFCVLEWPLSPDIPFLPLFLSLTRTLTHSVFMKYVHRSIFFSQTNKKLFFYIKSEK